MSLSRLCQTANYERKIAPVRTQLAAGGGALPQTQGNACGSKERLPKSKLNLRCNHQLLDGY